MPPPDWKSAIEVFPAGWVCPAEPFWIAGWIASPTLVPVDLRTRLGDRVFLGLCGLPRADKEVASRGQAGPPHAGFSFLLQPVAGAREISVEACDQHGRWTVIFRQAVTSAAPPSVPPPVARSSPAVRHLLQARHARPRAAWSSLAREVLAAENAVPLDVLPSPPFHGALEQFSAEAPVQHNRLLVTGWLAHRTQRITKLTAFLDTARPLPLLHGLLRPDALTLGVELRDGTHSGFAGYFDLPPDLPRPIALRVIADLDNGHRELVFTKRFRPVITSGAGSDRPPLSAWTFARAAWALWVAGWKPPGGWQPALAAAWSDYRAAASRPGPAVIGPAESAPPRPLRVALFTHNLNLEGAPLIAFEFARHLAAQPGWTVRVISPQDGALHDAYRAAGLAVEIIDLKPALAAASVPAFHRELQRVATGLRLEDTDVVAANTMVTFWAVLMAHRLRKPSILYTHESVSPRRFFAPHLPPELVVEAESAFTAATRVVFSAAASQRVHGHLPRRDHFRVLPGWIDVGCIQTYASAHPRAEVRRALGLPADAVVFANIGSVSARKGQLVFVDAIARLLSGQSAGAPLVFLMVGAGRGPNPYVDLVRAEIAERRLPGVRIVDQVTDAYAWHRAADIFVCSSFEEAFPRVVMEAAAFGVPVVSTDVDGIPEMLGPDDAWLVPPGDAAQLATAMAAALAAHRAGDRRRAERGRQAVQRFDSAALLPRHLALVSAVADLPPA
jgi:glycosyltransferase involved in cell wall biosynthesis